MKTVRHILYTRLLNSYMPSTASSEDISQEQGPEPPAGLNLDNGMDVMHYR